MAGIAERTSRGAGWSRGAGSFSAVLLLTDMAGHRLALIETPAFLWVLGIVPLLAALALLFAGFAFARLWNFGDRGGHDLTLGAVIALLVLAPYGIAAYWAAVYPALRDVSTDLDDPPALAAGAELAAPPTPGERRLQTENYPLVTSRSYDAPFDRAVETVSAVVVRQGWQLAAPVPATQGQSEVAVDALAASFVLGLPVDVAVRVRQDGDSVEVDMRSASRFGRHDLGDNAAKIVAFFAELDQEMARQAGVPSAE